MDQEKTIDYHLVGDDDIIDEKGNITIRLRNIYYGNKSDNVKLDLRKWSINDDGTERMGKGLSFLTPDGPNVLAEVLVQKGYGGTKEILSGLNTRPDFRTSLNSVLGKEDELYDENAINDNDTSFYDPRQCLI